MVLRASTFYTILTMFFIISCLSACSHLSSSSQNNRSPSAPVVPADAPAPQNKPMDDSAKSPINQDQTNSDSQENKDTLTETPKGKRLQPADVLGSILDSAKKAIESQQWLRAQHHLEHALRVAPKDAEVFYLYGLVYEGLGVQGQAINMLKRALFLAKANSDIHLLAAAKLAEITP
tara:strand:- start:8057 stop:8587 length:531 start_codon:yes stop_codon:yes gene_type:complete